jgi:hypothetical protein
MNGIGLHRPVERAIPKEQELCNEERHRDTITFEDWGFLLNNVGLHEPVERAIPKRNESYATRSMKVMHYKRIRFDLVFLFFIQQIGASNQ